MLNGTKLQYLRRLKGYTQVYIADCIGASERWVSKVECENCPISEELHEKWLQALYGNIKPQKKAVVKEVKNTELKSQQKKPAKKPSNK